MFEKRKRKKAMEQKAAQDSQIIYSLVNRIMHHYPIGLSVYEDIAYYTLAVAYGNIAGAFPDDELVHLRNHLYYSTINSGSSASRGMFGLQYDKILSEHFAALRSNGNNLFPVIESIIKQHNEIFPENPKDANQQELLFICGVFSESFHNIIAG